MPHSFGLRARTRDLFAKPFRQHGAIRMANYYTIFKVSNFSGLQNFLVANFWSLFFFLFPSSPQVGDIVDIKADGAIHKGMPHKYYHGKTGRVWNVSKRAVGVEVNKRVRGRIIPKRIHVRVEHVKKSASRQSFLDRVKENTLKRKTAKETKSTVSLFFLSFSWFFQMLPLNLEFHFSFVVYSLLIVISAKCPSLRRQVPQPIPGQVIKTKKEKVNLLSVPEYAELF